MRIKVSIVNGDGYVWRVEDIKILREKYEICGVLTGVLPQFPQQNVFQGLPLQLMPEELEYLVELDVVELVDDSRAIKNLEAVNKEAIGPLVTVKSPSSIVNASVVLEPARRRPRPKCYAVYKQLKQKSLFVLPGLRFGCQYMAYPGDMMRYHSHFNVNGYDWDEPFHPLTIISGGRLGTTVKKTWVVGAPEPGTGHARLFSVEWAGFG